ncbi:MAG: ABC transporter ATP-binding protein [Thermoanaerobaculia bacterium]|nr:ABC transporter ATP-binding protein [Thermoanaerobaculia bacterium]
MNQIGSLVGFLGRYFRRYLPSIGVAVAASLVYAACTVAFLALIEPIFGEVLLAERGEMGSFAALVGESGGEAADGVAPDSPGAAELPGSGQKGRFKRLLDEGYRDLKSALGVGPEEVVFFVPLLVIGIFLLRGVAGFTSGYIFDRVGFKVTTDIRNDLYRRILEQSVRFHARHPSGELMSRIVSDVAMMQTAVSTRVVDLFQQSLTLAGMVYLLFSTHRQLATISLVLLPALIFPIVRFGRGMRRVSHLSQQRMADLAHLVGDGVRGHRVVKAFGMEEFQHRRFRDATARHLRVNLWAQVLNNLSSPVVEALGVVAGSGLLIYAGFAIRRGELSAPLFISFLATLFWMYEPVRKLNKVNLILQQSLASAARVHDVMRLPNEIRDRPDARAIERVERDIGFDEVCFAYEDKPVLDRVSLTIRRGEVVALVGPSGAGKTTLVNLLPRFFDPDSGAVRIDGVDIRDLKVASLRALIGLVTQETILFDDTVRNNIASGRADLDDDRIRAAARAAFADGFIEEQERGYDTLVGEGGMKLSGGQRQRLAIARALVKDPPILILDEATSQLDSESEALVQKALYNLMQGRTTLVIAHRLSTVQRADRIVVLDRGRIAEEGTHRELVELGGLYRRLYDLQFRS